MVDYFSQVKSSLQNSGASWAYQDTTSASDEIRRFEVRPGDHWRAADGTKERSEISSGEKLQFGQTYTLSYGFMVEPGAKNTEDNVKIGQLHGTPDANDSDDLGPVFALQLDGEKMKIVVRSDPSAVSADRTTDNFIYADKNDLIQGHWYDIQIVFKLDPQGGGELEVWRDGVQIADYHGALGYNDAVGPYWKEGIYRAGGTGNVTMAMDFKDTTLVKGDTVNVATPTSASPAPINSPSAPPASTTSTSATSTSTAATGSDTSGSHETAPATVDTASTSHTSATVTATSVNSAPTIGGANATQTTNDKATATPFSTVVLSDPDVGQTETVNVSYTAANGTLSNLGGFVQVTPGNYTFSGSVAAAQAALQGLVFAPTANEVAPGASVATTFTVSDNDGLTTVSNNGAKVTTTSVEDAPMVSGGQTNQVVSDLGTISPFTRVTVQDPDVGQIETVTVTFNGATGTLSGGGFTGSHGSYTVNAASAAAAQADLRAAVFTPVAQPSGTPNTTTTFTVAVNDTQTTGSDSGTVVTTTHTHNTAPVIAGFAAGQTTTGKAIVSPFSAATITDPDLNQTETVTVTLSAASKGTLSGGGFSAVPNAPGVYQVQASTAAQAQADLRALIFTPTMNEVTPGQTVTTGFTVQVSDAQTTVSNNVTTLAATSVSDASSPNSVQVSATAHTTASVTTTTSEQTPSQQAGYVIQADNLIRISPDDPALNDATSPIYAQVQAVKTIAAQLDAGQITATDAQSALSHLVDGTTSVAEMSYAFFTRKTPTQAGLNYLVHSSANPTDLNDAYYAKFTVENRYINFGVNLATSSGAGAAAFQDAYGSLSLSDATAKAYAAVFGTTAAAGKVEAILNAQVANGLGGTETRAQYFADITGGTAIAQKAAVVGFLLADSVKEGFGLYQEADQHFLQDLAHGTATYNVDLLMAATPPLVGQPTADSSLTG